MFHVQDSYTLQSQVNLSHIFPRLIHEESQQAEEWKKAEWTPIKNIKTSH